MAALPSGGSPSAANKCLYSALVSLGLDIKTIESSESFILTAGSLNDLPKRVGEHILHHLLSVIDKEKTLKAFRDCWPPFDKKREAQFYRGAFELYKGLMMQSGGAGTRLVVSRSVVAPGSPRFMDTLRQLVKLALIASMKRKGVTAELLQPPAAALTTEQRRAALAVIHAHAVQQVQIFSAQQRSAAQQMQRLAAAARERVQQYRSCSTQCEQLKQQLLASPAPGGACPPPSAGAEPPTSLRAAEEAAMERMNGAAEREWRRLDATAAREALSWRVLESLVQVTSDGSHIDAGQLTAALPAPAVRTLLTAGTQVPQLYGGADGRELQLPALLHTAALSLRTLHAALQHSAQHLTAQQHPAQHGTASDCSDSASDKSLTEQKAVSLSACVAELTQEVELCAERLQHQNLQLLQRQNLQQMHGKHLSQTNVSALPEGSCGPRLSPLPMKGMSGGDPLPSLPLLTASPDSLQLLTRRVALERCPLTEVVPQMPSVTSAQPCTPAAVEDSLPVDEPVVPEAPLPLPPHLLSVSKRRPTTHLPSGSLAYRGPQGKRGGGASRSCSKSFTGKENRSRGGGGHPLPCRTPLVPRTGSNIRLPATEGKATKQTSVVRSSTQSRSTFLRDAPVGGAGTFSRNSTSGSAGTFSRDSPTKDAGRSVSRTIRDYETRANASCRLFSNVQKKTQGVRTGGLTVEEDGHISSSQKGVTLSHQRHDVCVLPSLTPARDPATPREDPLLATPRRGITTPDGPNDDTVFDLLPLSPFEDVVGTRMRESRGFPSLLTASENLQDLNSSSGDHGQTRKVVDPHCGTEIQEPGHSAVDQNSIVHQNSTIDQNSTIRKRFPKAGDCSDRGKFVAKGPASTDFVSSVSPHLLLGSSEGDDLWDSAAGASGELRFNEDVEKLMEKMNFLTRSPDVEALPQHFVSKYRLGRGEPAAELRCGEPADESATLRDLEKAVEEKGTYVTSYLPSIAPCKEIDLLSSVSLNENNNKVAYDNQKVELNEGPRSRSFAYDETNDLQDISAELAKISAGVWSSSTTQRKVFGLETCYEEVVPSRKTVRRSGELSSVLPSIKEAIFEKTDPENLDDFLTQFREKFLDLDMDSRAAEEDVKNKTQAQDCATDERVEEESWALEFPDDEFLDGSLAASLLQEAEDLDDGAPSVPLGLLPLDSVFSSVTDSIVCGETDVSALRQPAVGLQVARERLSVGRRSSVTGGGRRHSSGGRRLSALYQDFEARMSTSSMSP